MELQLALTFFGSLLGLVWGTLFCYYGNGSSYHRSKLEFIPRLWAFIFFTGAYFGHAIMDEHYVVVYAMSLMIAGIGWCLGYTIRAAIMEPGLLRLQRKMERERERALRCSSCSNR
jgi:hypothetical protein